MDEASWNGTSGEVLDYSGNNFNGTSSNASVTTGKFNNGGAFVVASNSYITVPSALTANILGGNAKSMTVWFKTTDSTASTRMMTAFGTNVGGSPLFILYINSGQKLGTETGSGGNTIASSTSVNDGAWHLATLTYDSTTLKLYLDNALAAQSTAGTLQSAASNFVIGAYSQGGYNFAGSIDEVRMYTSALSLAQISNLYSNRSYVTTNNPGVELVRKITTPDPTTSVGAEVSVLPAGGTWESATDSNIIDTVWNGGWGDGTAGSTAFTATIANAGTNNTIAFSMRVGDSTSALAAASYIPLGTANSGTTFTKTKAELDALGVATGTARYIQVKATLAQTSGTNPQLDNFTIYYLSDNTAPGTNASAIAMLRSAGGVSVAVNGWINNTAPYFSWTPGSDADAGLKGYCLYLGADAAGNPATAKGLLGTSPVSTTGTTCQFIVSGSSIDLATLSYRGSPWLTTANTPYYLNIKAIDVAGNVFAGSSAQIQFRFDSTTPTNVAYASCPGGSFTNVTDMSFSWPTSGGIAASDSNAGILGWQYQINSAVGTWLGTTTEAVLGINNYIPTSDSSYTLTEVQDASSISAGSNIVYLRAVDLAGNISSDIRTCNLEFGGAAPTFGGTDSVTVTPTTNTTNSYALSWPSATAANNRTVAAYYYMVNTLPPATLATLTGNPSTYVSVLTATSSAASSLPGINKGSNTVYVVAVDDVDNYSPSNYISGAFTLNSTDPDNVGSLVSSDSSIKSESKWYATLTWTEPTYQGAGNLTYVVKRSADGTTFAQVGTTGGLSYVDNTPLSAKYYYKIYSKDGANSLSSGTNAVSITPTGKWTSAPSLDSGPSVGSITTKKATITWGTSRSSDSKIAFGTSTGSYGADEVSNSSQTAAHSVNLTNLKAGTTYYYIAKWTDEDGNTGQSAEKNFSTSSAPTIKDVAAKNIGLTSTTIQYTSNNASKVKIYYGTSTSFGGLKEVSTSTNETAYTTELTGLLDGTKYYYKINTFDSDNSEYEGTVLDFTTLPRPKISNVRLQQVANTAQSTILVSWSTNTEVSGIVTYFPQNEAGRSKDEVNIALTKGEHQMIIRGLLPQTDYILIVKGRDKIGNEALSDSQRLTTATDTRPPMISSLRIEGSNIPAVSGTAQEQVAQLIVSWNTDEPSTSQVEFGEGTGTNYNQKTQEDSNLTMNHLVIITNLTPSKVYHLRSISLDSVKNIGRSIDSVTITPKTTENALNLVVTNLQQSFGFLKGLGK